MAGRYGARMADPASSTTPVITLSQRGRRHAGGPCLERYPASERSLTRLLADRAATSSTSPWVIADGTVLTFGDAFSMAARVAGALARDAPPRPRVGLMIGTRVEMLGAFHGALLAGGVAVPLNPELKGHTLRAVFERAGLDVLVADPAVVTRLGDEPTTPVLPEVRVVLDDVAEHGWRAWDSWVADVSPDPRRYTGPFPAAGDTAVVMFTSGTTGAPKGVVCSHHYAYAYGALVSDALRRGPEDVLTTSMPLFHSGGLHVILHSALHVGCRAHVKRRFSASQWWEEAAADGATQGLLVGPMAEMILRQVDSAPSHAMDVASISAFARRDEFERRYRVRVLWQGYGMTELYPVPMPREMAPTEHDDTIGTPVDVYDFDVVDEDDRPLGVGTVGELVVRPREVGFAFDGYLDDAAATAHAWRGGAFHTGDLVSCDDDGLLRYRGRRAERIRCRGENVDPSEVEAAATAFPGIVDAAAYGVPSELGDSDVKLDVVVASTGPEDRGPTVDLDALYAWLRTELARHAVPRYLEVLDEIPRNASARIERTHLAARPVDRPGVIDTRAPA